MALDPHLDLKVDRAKRMVVGSRPRQHRRPRRRPTSSVRASGIPVDEIALRRPTLDDAFLSLTGQPASDGAPAAPPMELAS